MITIETRCPTEEEATAITRDAKSANAGTFFDRFLALLLATGVSFLFFLWIAISIYAIWKWRMPESWYWATSLGGGPILTTFYCFFSARMGENDQRKWFLKLLSSPVEVMTCTTSSVIVVEEQEDEGLCYFIDVGSGQLLCLRGQYLYEYEDRLPVTSFRTIRLGAVLLERR